MSDDGRYTRRKLLNHGLVAGGAALLGRPGMLRVQQQFVEGRLRYTEEQVAGPFYPVVKPLDSDSDLTFVRGHSGRAAGQAIHVTGRVSNTQGRPIANAAIELWQANAHGRYAHGSDPNPAPLDPSFQGFAIQHTDSQGRYHFKTIKPGAYPVPEIYSSAGMRPPHIHFEVTADTDRLTTQMYFPDEPLNESDVAFNSAGAGRSTLIAALKEPKFEIEAGALLFEWDIVLPTG